MPFKVLISKRRLVGKYRRTAITMKYDIRVAAAYADDDTRDVQPHILICYRHRAGE